MGIKRTMDKRKAYILRIIKKCSSITEVLGSQFITTAIETYDTVEKIKWSPRNYFISNYFMSASFYPNQLNFISELENLFNYYLTTHKDYIKSKSVLSRLTTKNEALFQGKWSELIFTYYLKNHNIEIIDISKLEKTKDGENEMFDIKTNYGEIEVTEIMSDKGKVFDTEEVFMGSPEIGDIEKQLVNKKIKNKVGKRILAIDATFVDELYMKLIDATEGLKINFNVFKRTSKNVFLFLRNPVTQQVGLCKYLNYYAG